jgi:hypothetical protein
MTSTTEATLLRRLSALPGPGSPAEYRELLGPSVVAVLREAGQQADALVERQMLVSTYRPTPAELRTTWQSMQLESSGRAVATIAAASQRCRYCAGRGQLSCWVLRQRRGARQLVTMQATCTCPQGQRLHAAEMPDGIPRLSVTELEVRCMRQRLPEGSTADGVLGLHIEDERSGPRPQWTHWPLGHPPATSGNMPRPSWMR